MSGRGDGIENLVMRAKSFIEARRNSRLSVPDLARSLGLSASHFHRLFKHQTGVSPYQYYLNLRIERAKQMLEQTNQSMSEIAHGLAFDNAYDFSTAFKRRTGVCPTKWRACRGR